MSEKQRSKYKDFTTEQKKKIIEYSTKYNREVAARTTIKMTKQLDHAMMEYIKEHGYKSKNSFILELIKKEIERKE